MNKLRAIDFYDENTYQKLRNVLNSMKSRCNNPNEKSYHYYGGRGIKVCDRWSDPTRVGNNPSQGFLNFIEDMGSTYFEDATIDRIDNDGDYCPENCQWLSKSENIIKAHIGSRHSEEHRRKLSESLKGLKRKPFSEEHRRKIGESLKGRKHSDEARQKMSEAAKGRTLSEKHRRKLSESQKGRTFSDEHRRKISEARKRYEERKRQNYQSKKCGEF